MDKSLLQRSMQMSQRIELKRFRRWTGVLLLLALAARSCLLHRLTPSVGGSHRCSGP